MKEKQRKSLRPRFSQAIRDFMRERRIRSLNQMAQDFIEAGYPEPEKMYQQKLDQWINTREAVPDEFFMWLEETYKLTAEERSYLGGAFLRDAFYGKGGKGAA